jgi:hypothetical protein
MGYPYITLFNNVLLVTINLILDFIWIPVYGLMGAAFGSLVACTVTVSAQIIETYVLLKIKPVKWNMIYIVLFGAGIGVIFYGLRGVMENPTIKIFYDIVLGFIFIFLYIYLGWKMLFNPHDRQIISSIFKGNAMFQKLIK